MLRILLLLAERLTERSNRSNDSDCNERKGNKRPDNTPALRGSSVSLSELASIGGVDFAKDKVVTLYLQLAHHRHHTTSKMTRKDIRELTISQTL